MRLAIGPHVVALFLFSGLLATNTGCISLFANLMHAIHGNNTPAEYEGLREQRVAVICNTDEGFRSSAVNSILVNNLHAALSMYVEDIEIVRQSEVEQWVDVHGITDSNYVDIGKGVKADKVLAVEVGNLTLKNGQTLYRGQSDITVTVYDVNAGGSIRYRKQIPEFSFPQSGGKPITETSENKFRSQYLSVVTRKISSLFYPVDVTRDYALDATISSYD